MVEGRNLGLVGRVRRGVNDFVGRVPYVGGFLIIYIDVGSAARVGLTSVVLGAVTVSGSGCFTAAVGVAGYHAGKEKGRGDTDLENKKPEVYKSRLLVNKYKDFNNDGELQRKDEILEPVDDLINLDKVGLMIRLSATIPGDTIYSLIDSDYNRLADISVSSSAGRTMYAFNDFASNSFMETVIKLKPGKYTIHARLASRNFSKEIIVVRNSPVEDITNVSQ